MTELITLPAVWVPVVAALIPLLSAAAVRSDGSNRQRALVAIGASALLAIVEQATGDSFTVEALLATAATALVTEFTAYKTLWSPLFRINETVLPAVGIAGGERSMSAG